MAQQGGPQSSSGIEDFIIIPLLVIGIPILLFALFYTSHRAGFNTILLWVSRAEVWPFVFFSSDAAKLKLALDQADPSRMTWAQAIDALSLAGQYGRFWLLPPLLGLMYWVWKRTSAIETFTRRFTMRTLAEHNIAVTPCLAPVIRRARSILDEPTAQGPWRVQESPMLFALRHGIVRAADGSAVPESWCFLESGLPRNPPRVPPGGFYFDRKRAEEVYSARVGPPMPKISRDGIIGNPPPPTTERPKPSCDASIPLYMVGLIGAYCAFALGKRKQGIAIMDAMSLSFNEDAMEKARIEGTDIAGDFPIDIGNAEYWIREALKERSDEDGSSLASNARALRAEFEGRHDAFLWPWFGCLVARGRKVSGTSPPFEAIWLRPTNRPLWYYYEALGSMTPSPEGAGPWAHHLAEHVHAQQQDQRSGSGKPSGAISTPYVKPAVDALKRGIDDEGWFDLVGPEKSGEVKPS